MAQLYSKKKPKSVKLPKKETIAFLLGYSKALHIVKKQNTVYEIVLN